MVDEAQTPISFDRFPESKLDHLSEELAAKGKVSWPPVTSDITEVSKRSATSSKSSRLQTRNAQTATSGKSKVSDPKTKKLPRQISGCYWANNGAGWLLHRTKRDANNRNPRIGHLSKSRYEEMKREYKGDALLSALTEWAKLKAAEKGIQL